MTRELEPSFLQQAKNSVYHWFANSKGVSFDLQQSILQSLEHINNVKALPGALVGKWVLQWTSEIIDIPVLILPRGSSDYSLLLEEGCATIFNEDYLCVNLMLYSRYRTELKPSFMTPNLWSVLETFILNDSIIIIITADLKDKVCVVHWSAL